MTSSKSEFDKIIVNFSMLVTPFKLIRVGRGEGDNMLKSSIIETLGIMGLCDAQHNKAMALS
jgi:hypothetical protein